MRLAALAPGARPGEYPLAGPHIHLPAMRVSAHRIRRAERSKASRLKHPSLFMSVGALRILNREIGVVNIKRQYPRTIASQNRLKPTSVGDREAGIDCSMMSGSWDPAADDLCHPVCPGKLTVKSQMTNGTA